MTKEEAAIAAQTLEAANFSVVSTKEYVASAAAIAVELDHPACDAVYLATAEALGLRYMTADGRLIRRSGKATADFGRSLLRSRRPPDSLVRL